MCRAKCRYCGRPQTGRERYCSPSCRLLAQGRMKPEADPSETWELVAKTTNPRDWGGR